MHSEQWVQSGPPRLFIQDGDKVRSNSLSGRERNRLKMARGGNYVDASLVSGADFKQDGRGFVLFDYDHDGWMDMGLVSPHAPRFRIMRNKMADLYDKDNLPEKAVTIRLQGGNETSQPSDQWSSRNAYGAKILVTTQTNTRAFLHSFSGGLSCKNADQISIGMGDQTEIEKLEIQWPSGKTTVREKIAAGSQIKILEKEE